MDADEIERRLVGGVASDLCPARISGVLIGIVLFYILVSVMIDGLLKTQPTFQIASTSFSARHLRYKLINVAIFIGGLLHARDDMTSAQEIMFLIGSIGSCLSLLYMFILEDTYPYQLLAPFLKFSNNMSLDDWWVTLCDLHDGQTLAVDMKYKLGVTKAKVLSVLVEAFDDRMRKRFENNRSIVDQSMITCALNIALFCVNMTAICRGSEHDFVLDVCSVSAIVLTLAMYEDYCDVHAGDYLIVYNKKLGAIRKYVNSLKPMTFVKAVKTTLMAMRMRRTMGHTGPSTAVVDPMAYKFNMQPYEKKKKGYVEDLVEDASGLFNWYLDLKSKDEERAASFAVNNEPPTTCGDARALAVVFAQLVADDLVRRTAAKKKKVTPAPVKGNKNKPVEEEEPPRANANIMSILLLSVQSELIKHITNEIIDKDYSVVDQFEIRETMVQLWIVAAIQKSFDERNGLSAPQCCDAMYEAAKRWADEYGPPLNWTSAYASKHVEEISHRMIDNSDINLKDNSGIVDLDWMEAPMNEIMQILDFEADAAGLEHIWGELFDRERHLESTCLFKGVSSSERRNAERREKKKNGPSATKASTLTYNGAHTNALSVVGDLFKTAKLGEDGNTGMSPMNISSPNSKGGDGPKRFELPSTGVDKKIAKFLSYKKPVKPFVPIDMAEAKKKNSSVFDDEDKITKEAEGNFIATNTLFIGRWLRNSHLKKYLSTKKEIEKKTTDEPSETFGDKLAHLGRDIAYPFVATIYWIGKLANMLATWLVNVVFGSQTFEEWANSPSNPFYQVKMYELLLHSGGEALILGIFAYNYFRCVRFMGTDKFGDRPRWFMNDWTSFEAEFFIITMQLIPIWLALIPTNTNSLKECVAAIIPGVAITLGSYLVLTDNQNSLNDVTYLGVPAKYDMDRVDISFLAPVLYGMMHNCMIMFSLLPLTMCRALITWIMDIPYHGEWLSIFLGIHEMYYQHRQIGYIFFISLTTSACIWWALLYRSCADGNSDPCQAFYPSGIYVDIRGPPWFCDMDTIRQGDIIRGHKTPFRQKFPFDSCVMDEDGNPDAVIFLREAVIVSCLSILVSAEFKYPALGMFDTKPKPVAAVAATPVKAEAAPEGSIVTRCVDSVAGYFNKKIDWFWDNIVMKNQFEIFMYTHVLFAYTVFFAAVLSRLEVFYPSVFCWGLYFLDRLYVIWNEHQFFFSRKFSANYDGAYKLTLKKRHGKRWVSKAGQIVFLQCPELGELWLGRQWHAFSLSSSNCENIEETHDRIELLIQAQGKDSWTQKLREVAFNSQGEVKMVFNIRGPFGSSFQGFDVADFVMLIGGGSGVAGSLSVLRQMVFNRGSVKRCWFIYATRQFSSVQWCWEGLKEVLHPPPGVPAPPSGFLRISIHVSAHLTPVQQGFIDTQGGLRGVFKSGRPDWKKIFRSFGAQNLGGKGIKKTKVCACANKAIYADIDRALVALNDPTLDIEFSSENFE